VGTGFRKRSCSNNKREPDEDSKKNHPAPSIIDGLRPKASPYGLEADGEAVEPDAGSVVMPMMMMAMMMMPNVLPATHFPGASAFFCGG
jgi:hypothetical protein